MELMKMFEEWAPIGVLYGIIAFVLAKWVSPVVAQYLPAITVTMSTIEVNIRAAVAAGRTSALANFALAYFNLNLGMPDFVMMLISSVLLVLIGTLIYSFFPFGKTVWQKLAAVFVYGAVVEGVILGAITGLDFALGSILLTMVAYAIVIATVMAFTIKFIPGIKLPAMK